MPNTRVWSLVVPFAIMLVERISYLTCTMLFRVHPDPGYQSLRQLPLGLPGGVSHLVPELVELNRGLGQRGGNLTLLVLPGEEVANDSEEKESWVKYEAQSGSLKGRTGMKIKDAGVVCFKAWQPGEAAAGQVGRATQR